MPVVLVEVGGVARSGHSYDDRTGTSYEYPRGRYERWIRPGEQFVYQTPGVGYVGSGIIGEIRPAVTAGRLVCEVLAVRAFIDPVSLKDPEGNYYEEDPTIWKRKVYWGQGVRPLSEQRFAAIAGAVDTSVDISDDAVNHAYASPRDADQVEAYSVGAAVRHLQATSPAEIQVMPHSNPGFDLLVRYPKGATMYVEVKGTRSSAPRFFISEGERRFSAAHADDYLLVVVTGIDLVSQRHESIVEVHGDVNTEKCDLTPRQWQGVVRSEANAPVGA